MRTIHKYIVASNRCEIEMPHGAEIFSCQTQHGVPTIWACVDTEQPTVKRMFRAIGTGDVVPTVMLMPVGTCQMHQGEFVMHVFEEFAEPTASEEL